MTRIADLGKRPGCAWIRSTMFFRKASNKSTFEVSGWPSTNPLGLTKDTEGKLSLATSEKKSTTSLVCSARAVGFDMIDLAYCIGLQTPQNAFGRPATASLKPPP